MQSYFALITLLEGAPGTPTHPIAPGGPPPGFWGGVAPPLPGHPIAPGGRPPGFWGGVAPPYPDQGLPGWQPRPSHPIVIPPGSLGPGTPSHPIVIPQPPVEPTYPIVIPPDAVAPGVPAHPIYLPVHPAHPIVGEPPTPEHPIVMPPVPPTEPGDKALVLVVTAGYEPTWFIIDHNDGLKPSHPQPKGPVSPA